MTVSRVLAGSSSVSEKKRQYVLKIIAELGYVPSVAARSLRSKDLLRASSANCFSLIFGADTQNADEFFCDIARGVERESAQYGLCPLQVHWQESFNSSWPRLQTVLSITGMSGTLLAGQFSKSDIENIQKYTSNVVVIDGPVPDNVSIASVESDNPGGCKLALSHLAEQHCRRVLVITGPRRHYFTQAMEESVRHFTGIFDRIDVVESDYTIRGGMAAMHTHWEAGEKYDGVFSNDTMALGANYALSERGVAVPEQVKIIGFDNVIYGQYSQPPLSTIDIDKTLLGKESVKTLVDMIRGNKDATHFKKVIPAKLIVRASTISGDEL